LTIMSLYNSPGNGQTQAGSARVATASGIGAVKTVKDMG
jgi:hypothetical protein